MECGNLGSWCKASHRTCRERIGPAGRWWWWWWWWYIWFISSWLYHYHQRHRLNHHTNSDIHWLFISIHLCNSLLGIVIAIILRWHLRESKAIEISRAVNLIFLMTMKMRKMKMKMRMLLTTMAVHPRPLWTNANSCKQVLLTRHCVTSVRLKEIVSYTILANDENLTHLPAQRCSYGRQRTYPQETHLDGQSQRHHNNHHNDVFVPVQIQRHQPWGSIRLSSPSCHSHTPDCGE